MKSGNIPNSYNKKGKTFLLLLLDQLNLRSHLFHTSYGERWLIVASNRKNDIFCIEECDGCD